MTDNDDPNYFKLRGLVPRTIQYVFDAISKAANTKKYLVRTSFL